MFVQLVGLERHLILEGEMRERGLVEELLLQGHLLFFVGSSMIQGLYQQFFLVFFHFLFFQQLLLKPIVLTPH